MYRTIDYARTRKASAIHACRKAFSRNTKDNIHAHFCTARYTTRGRGDAAQRNAKGSIYAHCNRLTICFALRATGGKPPRVSPKALYMHIIVPPEILRARKCRTTYAPHYSKAFRRVDPRQTRKARHARRARRTTYVTKRAPRLTQYPARYTRRKKLFFDSAGGKPVNHILNKEEIQDDDGHGDEHGACGKPRELGVAEAHQPDGDGVEVAAL